MVFDPQGPVDERRNMPVSEPPPRMFSRPAEQAPLLPKLADDERVRSFRAEWSVQLEQRRSARRGSLRTHARYWAGRVTGRADRRLLFAVAGATASMSRHVDELSDRLTARESLGAEVIATLGEEITLLRTEVMRLQNRVTALEPDPA
jgi:hypothetical protein